MVKPGPIPTLQHSLSSSLVFLAKHPSKDCEYLSMDQKPKKPKAPLHTAFFSTWFATPNPLPSYSGPKTPVQCPEASPSFLPHAQNRFSLSHGHQLGLDASVLVSSLGHATDTLLHSSLTRAAPQATAIDATTVAARANLLVTTPWVCESVPERTVHYSMFYSASARTTPPLLTPLPLRHHPATVLTTAADKHLR